MVVGLSAYKDVLSDRAARSFSLAGLVARMPLSMTGLGVVLLVSAQTGSFGRAGLVAAFGTIAGAVAAPIWGRLTDRIGQGRVLLSAVSLNTMGTTVLVVTVLLRWPLWTSLAAAVLLGLGFSFAGACVRARWSYRLAGSPRLNTAFAVEAMLDEVVFIVGPVLVTFLATSIHPALGLVACATLGVLGAVALAAQRDTEPPITNRQTDRSPREPIPVARVLPLALASIAIGAIFGGMEVVVVAFAKAAGVLEYSGFILLAWAFGSLVSGLVIGTITWKSTAAKRFRVSAALLALSTLPLPFVDSPLLVALLLVLSGLAISPTMIASASVAQAAVPPSRLTEAFGWTTMGLAAGVAVGAASLGRAIDVFGAQAGFWGVVIAGAFLIVMTLLVRTPAATTSAAPGDPTAAPVRRETGNPSH